MRTKRMKTTRRMMRIRKTRRDEEDEAEDDHIELIIMFTVCHNLKTLPTAPND